MSTPSTAAAPAKGCNYILESNLFDALAIAVRVQRETEAKVSPEYRSTFRAGLEENLAAMRAGQRLEIR